METTTNPMKDAKSYLEPWQIDMILNSFTNPRDKLLYTFLARTGRRVSEVVRCVKPSDIDFTNGLINFLILKRKRETRLLLPVELNLLSGLKKYIEDNQIGPDQSIFTISRQTADRLFKKACEGLGIIHVGTGKYNRPHVHLLRHSFAIQGAKLLKSPADLVQLKELLGHSRIDTTMFYLKFNPTETKELLKEMWK